MGWVEEGTRGAGVTERLQTNLLSNIPEDPSRLFTVLCKVSTVVSIVVSTVVRSVRSNRTCGLVRVQFPPRNLWQVVAPGTSSDIHGLLFSLLVASNFAFTHFYQ